MVQKPSPNKNPVHALHCNPISEVSVKYCPEPKVSQVFEPSGRTSSSVTSDC